MAEKSLDLHVQFPEIDHLELLAKQVVEGFIIGLHKSPFHGFSVEFAEHRLYNPGESVRNMDWKVYARTQKMFVKKYEEETNLRCHILLDVSPSMYFPKDQPYHKLRFSAVASAALMYLMKKQRDAFALTLFADQILQSTQARSTQIHYHLLLSLLNQYINHPVAAGKTMAAQSLHEIAEKIHKRSMVVIFSDMLDVSAESDALMDALQHLKYNKHEVIVFHVADQSQEVDFQFDHRPHRFVDMETGSEIKVQPQEIKALYQEKMQEFRKKIALRCSQFQIDLIEVDARQSYHQILLPYLNKRLRLY